jgi:hypothetical protein
MCLSVIAGPGELPVPGLSLGWLVVVQSPDEKRLGTLISLVKPASVLSRGVTAALNGEEWFDFSDDFMSTGHAIVNRPAGPGRQEAFTIRDRQHPGPSSNGTFVNSKKLGRDDLVKLSEGDIIRVGSSELVFKSLWLPPSNPGSL